MAQFLGLCPFMGVSNNLESTIGMAVATSFVLTISSVCGYLLFHYLLVPLNLEFIKTIAFILVIAVVVQITEIVIKNVNPVLYKILGVFLPLITTNCAVLGVALLNTKAMTNSLVESVTFGLGSAIGFSLVLILFAAMRERLTNESIPVAFRGSAISLITAGLMSLAFMGFSGLVKW